MSTSLPALKITDEDGRYVRERRLDQGLSADSYLDLSRPFKLDE